MTKKKDNSKQGKRQIGLPPPSLPYNKYVTTKLGKFFSSLIDKHFLSLHKLHKSFNRNNVKVSYSCLPNIKNQ